MKYKALVKASVEMVVWIIESLNGDQIIEDVEDVTDIDDFEVIYKIG
jgi:hypothetical protein